MIDTIVLRIHNLKKYEKTVNVLFSTKKKNSTTVIGKGQGLEPNQISNEIIGIIYNDSSSFIPISHNGSTHISSSHYNLYYSINFLKDYIEFNFSIPKYLYGTNICQFVSRYFDNCDSHYDNLIYFIKEFVRGKIFVELIDEYDIEINRLDLCYNQFFSSKNEALKYLDQQAKLLTQYNKQAVRVKVYPEEGIEIVTDRYKFKIYHKGAEFAKNDSRKVKNLKGFTVEDLQREADLILRYEITYRNSYFNYLFRQMYIEDGKQRQPGILRKLYKVIKIDHKFEANQFGSSKKKAIKMNNKTFRLKSAFDLAKTIERDAEQQGQNKDWYLPFIGDNCHTFSKVIFRTLYFHFQEYFKKFQIKTTISPETIQEKIQKQISIKKFKNEKKIGAREKVENINRIMKYVLMTQNHPLSFYYHKKLISESTYFRVKKSLEQLGLGVFNPPSKLVVPFPGYAIYFEKFGIFHIK